jgi:multidrug efflux pump subunit AcrA (membrane-fusion protein)
MFATASISAGDSRAVLAVPESAIYQIDGHSAVFAAAANNGFEVRPVRLGSRGGDMVEIISGLKQGELVVEKGGLALKALIANKAD